MKYKCIFVLLGCVFFVAWGKKKDRKYRVPKLSVSVPAKPSGTVVAKSSDIFSKKLKMFVVDSLQKNVPLGRIDFSKLKSGSAYPKGETVRWQDITKHGKNIKAELKIKKDFHEIDIGLWTPGQLVAWYCILNRPVGLGLPGVAKSVMYLSGKKLAKAIGSFSLSNDQKKVVASAASGATISDVEKVLLDLRK
ncbi:hypothetical protein HN446_03870 [bacterium]|jgi:hypothetical protein|nr:hypothetical protein [bacterium]